MFMYVVVCYDMIKLSHLKAENVVIIIIGSYESLTVSPLTPPQHKPIHLKAAHRAELEP